MTIKEIIDKNSGLVYSIAKKLYLSNRRRDKGFDLEDLAQVGFLAICKYGHLYDENRGKISTFLFYCVRNEMLKFLKSKDSDYAGTADMQNIKEPSYEHDFESMSTNLDDYFDLKQEEERAILALKLQNFNYEEISQQRAIAKSRVGRVIKKIKERNRNA